jgi:CheY-like chemotaxis protein
MIVDDEPTVAKTVEFLLKAEGFKTEVVFSGDDCLKKLESGRFDVVLLDIMMPKMNGWQVFEEIKKRYPEQKVAFLTVIKYSDAMREKLAKDGLSGFITKPFDNEDLIDRVRQIASK